MNHSRPEDGHHRLLRQFRLPLLTFWSKVRTWSNELIWISTLTTVYFSIKINFLFFWTARLATTPQMTQGRFFNLKFSVPPTLLCLGFWNCIQIRVTKPSLNVGHKVSLVWYNPARGLCTPGYALIFENRSGRIFPWEWRMPDREHGIVSRESGSASHKKSCDADFRSHGE